MARHSHGNTKCERIVPIIGSEKKTGNLATVAFRLTTEQAAKLAKNLLAAVECDKIIPRMVDVTGLRNENRITVTCDPIPRRKRGEELYI